MLFYFSYLVLSVCALSLLEVNNNLQKNILFFLLLYLLFFSFFFSFVRWETGTDWDGYYEYFNHIFIIFSGFRF